MNAAAVWFSLSSVRNIYLILQITMKLEIFRFYILLFSHMQVDVITSYRDVEVELRRLIDQDLPSLTLYNQVRVKSKGRYGAWIVISIEAPLSACNQCSGAQSSVLLLLALSSLIWVFWDTATPSMGSGMELRLPNHFVGLETLKHNSDATYYALFSTCIWFIYCELFFGDS